MEEVMKRLFAAFAVCTVVAIQAQPTSALDA